jgi:hypothetical protein
MIKKKLISSEDIIKNSVLELQKQVDYSSGHQKEGETISQCKDALNIFRNEWRLRKWSREANRSESEVTESSDVDGAAANVSRMKKKKAPKKPEVKNCER